MSKITCSLCYHDLAPNELRAHQQQETREIIEYTIEMIKARHPKWAEGDPTCQLCWEYYRGIPTT